jgi:hypothetical protein
MRDCEWIDSAEINDGIGRRSRFSIHGIPTEDRPGTLGDLGVGEWNSQEATKEADAADRVNARPEP